MSLVPPASDLQAIAARKADHLRLATTPASQFSQVTTMLEHVRLVHQALPELNLGEVELTTSVGGLALAVPIVITGMTGGAPQSAEINRDLARLAVRVGAAFGVGSQRAMAEHPELTSTYAVRDAAPDVVLLGNLGVMQAMAMGPTAVRELAARIGANAMAIHLNAAQELAQDRGDTAFRGAVATIGHLVDTLGIPVIVKETGCGIAPRLADELTALGVAAIDVAGAGGTSWVAVEAQRATDEGRAATGEQLREWGIPTAVTTAICARRAVDVIASGGIRGGLDVARALALGARACGVAGPVLAAWQRGGYDEAARWLAALIASTRATMLLAGARNVAAMKTVPRYLEPALASYIAALDPASTTP
ncbi:MAG: type 2 isopentenyl-diphosphate Delta-isomerase [Myxococcales bacterium]|nr:type 2 isopentenyl-diphosphate Delta-isomerase [Myxococcales bacterium]